MSPAKYSFPVVGTPIGTRVVASAETRRNSNGGILWLMRCLADHSQWVDASKLSNGEAQICAECVRVAQRAKREAKKSDTCAATARLSSMKAPLQVRLVADRLDRELRAVSAAEVGAWLGVELRRALRYLNAATKAGRARFIPGDVRTPDRWVSVLVVEPAAKGEGVAA